MWRKLIPVQEQKGFLYCCKKSGRKIYKHYITTIKIFRLGKFMKGHVKANKIIKLTLQATNNSP
jgi:hypothetical protein